jgi:L-lactate dehydrogenase complex protein LldF
MNNVTGKTVKERAAQALKDKYLIDAVKNTTEKLRLGKQKAAKELGNWEEWRERARQIRLHTIAHLDYYLREFANHARRQGVYVHFAQTGQEAVNIVLDIASQKKAKSVIKSKSMVSEEIHLNHALQKEGFESIETDFGEYLIQLAQETPSHIIIPTIHKSKKQIAELLSKEAGKTLPENTKILAEFMRQKLRQKFITADIGITGCNFAIAESGSIVLFENEGNIRMVSTLPETHITLMGMERIIPTWEDLEVMATLLPRSATGQKITAYMSVITGPRKESDGDGPEEMHVIILDNGRSNQLGDPKFQELLNCIRCGACLNVCPVYKQIGGHAYGGVYSGPIGAVLTPAFNRNVAEWDDVMDASTLCGACYEACPVKIPLHDMLVYLRNRKVESGYTSFFERSAMKGFSYATAKSDRFNKTVKLARWLQKPLIQDGKIKVKMGPLKAWTAHRHAPFLQRPSFRERWEFIEQNQFNKIHLDIKKRLDDVKSNKNLERGGNKW